MKYVKILGLLAVAAAALMAFAASASATTITSPTGTSYTGHIHAENEGTHVSLHNSIANIECHSTVTIETTSHGKGVTAEGHVKELVFDQCTNGWTVVVNSGGTVVVHWTSGYNGTLTSTGATVTAIRHTIFGTVECRYATAETNIGTITGGSPATLAIAAEIPFHGGSGLCGSGKSGWTGNYTTTSAVYLDE